MRIFDRLRFKKLQNQVLILTALSFLSTFLFKSACVYFAWNSIIVRYLDCTRMPILPAMIFTLALELFAKLKIDFAAGSRNELKKLQDIMKEDDLK